MITIRVKMLNKVLKYFFGNKSEPVILYDYSLKEYKDSTLAASVLTSAEIYASTEETPHLSIVAYGKEYTFCKGSGISVSYLKEVISDKNFRLSLIS
jgi:hypothetical protein